MNHVLREGDFDQAHTLLKEMVSFGHEPNVVTHSTFIHAYCSIGNIKEAEKIMLKMKQESSQIH